jgi:hypothetical protein
MINWQITASTLKASTLDGSARAQVALQFFTALETAGTAYSRVGNDSKANFSLYGASVSTWWNGSALAAWKELDRISRYAFSIASQADKTAAASAFGVTGTVAPSALPPDVTGETTATLNARVTAALAMTSVPAAVQTILSTTLFYWTVQISARPAPSSAADTASTNSINALNTALSNANAFIAALAFA